MEKLTFKSQMILGIIVLIVGNTLAFILHKGYFAILHGSCMGYFSL